MQRHLTIILFVCCVVLVRAANIPIAILSPDFGASYRPYWSLNGTSTIVNDKLQLTDDVTNQSGTAFWTGTVCNSNGFKFSAFFSFTITHSGPGSYADGLAFIIQQYANSWGAPGGGLGYEGLPGKSIAIEYDTYRNSNYNDPDINHIAIDFGGSVAHSSNKYYANSTKLNNIGVTLTAGKTFYSWIDYDGTKVEVRISTTTTRPATAVFSYTCDLASYFDGANVYYGFGGATGASMEQNLINSAYINNDYTPIDFLSNTYTQKTPSVSTTNASICRGESYTFNGTAYTTAGTYEAHLTNAVGCDSTATLQLTVREPSASTTTASICRGESFTFNGSTYTTAGTYTAHLTNAVGCDSTTTLQLTVREPSSSTTTASICRGESYAFNGTTYTTAGTYAAQLTNAVGCDSTATLQLVVKEPSSSTTTTSICRGESYTFNGTAYTTAGTYAAHLTNAVGCDSTATLVLMIKEPSSSTTTASICRGESYIFNGTTYTTAGTYAVHLTNAAGCDSTATLQLTVREPSSSTTTASICRGESYTFNGITYTTAGTYVVHLVNAIGCDSTAALVLQIKEPSSSTSNAFICRGESYAFNGTTYTTAGTYAIHLVNGVGCDSTATLVLQIKEPSSSTTNVAICRGESYTFNGTTYTTGGTYSAYLTNAVGCDSTASLVLTLKEPSSSTTTASICRGESYSFNGTDYATAGTYAAHLVNAAGCDSTATLQLSVGEPSSSTTNASICRGDSYTFNGTNYTTAGTYSAHLTNALGCDSTATLQLCVREPSSFTTTASICRGESYLFNGSTYTTAGTYAAHLINAVGCDSTATLQLSVKEPSSSTTTASICRDESYTFNGTTYTTAGTYAAHLTNAVGCDSTATLQLSVREPSNSTTTASICRGESYSFNGATYTTAGTYAAHLTNAAGCDSIATLVLTVKEPSSSTTTAAICRGETYTFNGTNYATAGTYAAHLINAVGCDSTATLQLSVREPSSSTTTASICRGESYVFNGTDYTTAGTYVVHLTNAAGCDSTATLQLSVKEPSSSTITTSICRGESYSFNGTTYTTAGTYVAHLVNAVGCDSTATLVLTVKEPSSSTTTASICRGESYTFNGTTYTTGGTYAAHLINAVGCDSTATLQLFVREPSSSVTTTSICRGETYTFNGTTYAIGGTYTAHLTNAVGCDSTATLQLVVKEPSCSTTTASICRGESYTFNGTTYTTAGTYAAHLTNAVGCDSTATLQLTVKESSSSTTMTSICRGESYTFNGTAYTTAGTYAAHLVNAAGCDSTATLQLTVKEPSSSTTNASICRGESYSFNGTTYTAAGTYAAHLVSAVGCDSTATLQLTVKEPSSSTTMASICRGESYTFNGTTYTTAGTYAAHLTNAVGCDSTATLQLTVKEPSSSTTMASICRGESYTFNGATYTTAGTYAAHLTNAVGCDSTATLQLTVKEPSSSITTASICRGESYTFNGTDYATAGTYSAHLTNAVGCDSTATLQLSVREPSSSTTTSSICRGETYTFNGIAYTTGGTYAAHLTNAVGCDSTATLKLTVREPSSSIITAAICRGENYSFNGVTYTIAGTYAVHLTNAVGCDSTATLHLTVGNASSSTNMASICKGDSYVFNGTTYTTAGTYVAHLTNTVGCDSTATLVLTVKEPSSSITTASICRGENYTFNGATYTTAGTYAVHLVNAVGCDSTATLQLSVREPSGSTTTASICRGESYTFNGKAYTTAGTYEVHLINAVGCDSTATLKLNVREPSSSITTASICHGESYLFNGKVYSSVGTYTVHLTNAVGCDSAATLQLNICYSKMVQMSDTIYQNQNYAEYGFSVPMQKKYGDLTFYQHQKTVQGCDSTVVLNLTVSPDFEVEVKPVPEICADDKYFTLTYEIKRGAIEFDSVAFDSNALKMGFKNMKMRSAVGFIDIPLPSNVVPNKYNFSVVFRNGYIQKEVPVTIAINYASSVILQKWNDVLALLNSSYNGGYEFLSYQWYKNNQIMDGETRSYLYVKNGALDTTAEYKAKVTRVSDGVALFTCPVIPVVKSDVAVFPTEFSTATNVTIRTTAPGTAVLMKSSGIRLKQQVVQRGDNSMLVSVPAGNYVLVITNEQGDAKRQVLIVK